MALGTEYRSIAAQALLGSSHTSLVPDVLWIGWLSTTGTELTATRVPVDNTDEVWEPTTNGVANVDDIAAGTSTAAWIIGRVALFDAATDGQVVLEATLPAPVTVGADEILALPAGSLTFQVA